MAKPIWTDTQVNNQLRTDEYWHGSSISYGFPSTTSSLYATEGELAGFTPLNATQQSGAQLAMLTWADLIRAPIQYGGNTGNDIEFGMTNTGIEFAHAYFPVKGSVWFNKTESDLVRPVSGKYGFYTYVHEIGHALGLDHMGDYNGEGRSEPSSWQDSSVFTVMSYYGPSNNSGGEGQVAWADWQAGTVEYSPQTPMLNDVMAIQGIYGASTTVRSEDTTYGFGSNIQGRLSEIYDFTKNANPILCIYDAGGNDTIDLSGWRSSSTVDLVGGDNHFSSGNGMTSNLQIARGVVIENATTGAGNDVLIGNAVANRLVGGAGNDRLQAAAGDDRLTGGAGNDDLNGGTGFDHMICQGKLVEYQIRSLGDGRFSITDLLTARDGADTFTQIERILFSDQMVVGLDTAAGETSGEAYRLYKAAFDRAPDPGGLGFWINTLDDGALLSSVSNGFINSPEFTAMYGADSTDAHFVTLLYNHVLHRNPDAQGEAYWLGQLDRSASRADVLTSFSESPENIAQVLPLIANGVQYQEWYG